MKVLITGATGLVGHELIKTLLQNGIAVNYLTTSRKKIAKETNYKGYYWNPLIGEINENAFDDVDVIIHLAGANVASRWTNNYKQEILDSRTKTTRLLYKTLSKIKHQVVQVISASAIGIYPDSLNKVYKEDDDIVDDSFLGKVVSHWESEVSKLESLSIQVVKIRIGIVLSEKGGALHKMAQPIKCGVGASFGSGEQFQSWIHIQDLVSIFHFAITHKLNGVYNAVSPYPVTNKELTKMIKIAQESSFGAKITGSGGGGCIFALTNESNLQNILKKFKDNNYECFSTKIDFKGLNTF